MVPFFDGQLARDDGGKFGVTVFDHFEQVVALGFLERPKTPVILGNRMRATSPPPHKSSRQGDAWMPARHWRSPA